MQFPHTIFFGRSHASVLFFYDHMKPLKQLEPLKPLKPYMNNKSGDHVATDPVQAYMGNKRIKLSNKNDRLEVPNLSHDCISRE